MGTEGSGCGEGRSGGGRAQVVSDPDAIARLLTAPAAAPLHQPIDQRLPAAQDTEPRGRGLLAVAKLEVTCLTARCPGPHLDWPRLEKAGVALAPGTISDAEVETMFGRYFAGADGSFAGFVATFFLAAAFCPPGHPRQGPPRGARHTPSRRARSPGRRRCSPRQGARGWHIPAPAIEVPAGLPSPTAIMAPALAASVTRGRLSLGPDKCTQSAKSTDREYRPSGRRAAHSRKNVPAPPRAVVVA